MTHILNNKKKNKKIISTIESKLNNEKNRIIKKNKKDNKYKLNNNLIIMTENYNKKNKYILDKNIIMSILQDYCISKKKKMISFIKYIKIKKIKTVKPVKNIKSLHK